MTKCPNNSACCHIAWDKLSQWNLHFKGVWLDGWVKRNSNKRCVLHKAKQCSSSQLKKTLKKIHCRANKLVKYYNDSASKFSVISLPKRKQNILRTIYTWGKLKLTDNPTFWNSCWVERHVSRKRCATGFEILSSSGTRAASNALGTPSAKPCSETCA